MLVEKSTDTKIISNDIRDTTFSGTVILDSTGTKILSNDISRSGDTGIVIFGPERANNDAKVVGNNISGGAWGMYVGDVTKGGSIAANTIRNNCAGMFFEADQFDEHVVGFEVRVTRSRTILARVEPRNSTGMSRDRHRASWRGEWHGAYGQPPLGQRPWPHPCLWGVVVSTDPYFKKSSRSP